MGNPQHDDRPNVWLLASNGDIDAIRAAIESKDVGVDEKDQNGYAILHAAACWNQTELAKYLIENGANVNIQDDEGDTPLHYAEHDDVVRVLLDAGALPMLKNNDNMLPIQVAFQDDRDAIVAMLKPLSPADVELLRDDDDFNLENEEIINRLLEMAQK